jgi:HSP20 family protein
MANQITYNPYRAINELQQQMERLWQERSNAQSRETNWQPVVDIFETEAELVLLSELPGLQDSDFKLSVENNVLTLSGERKLGNGNQYKVHRQERPSGTFQRSFSLPANFDASRVNANFQQGILRISLPKKAEARPREIPVKTV